jgi:hypothetical protein
VSTNSTLPFFSPPIYLKENLQKRKMWFALIFCIVLDIRDWAKKASHICITGPLLAFLGGDLLISSGYACKGKINEKSKNIVRMWGEISDR